MHEPATFRSGSGRSAALARCSPSEETSNYFESERFRERDEAEASNTLVVAKSRRPIVASRTVRCSQCIQKAAGDQLFN